jgi:hypothetical protein
MMAIAYRIEIGKPGRKKPCRKPRFRRENDTEIDLKEIGYEGVEWSHLSQNRVSSTVWIICAILHTNYTSCY